MNHDTTSTSDERPVLLLAPTGKSGRRVAARLHAAGVPVRPASRSTDPAFDWADPSTWQPALAGARAAYVAYSPDLMAPGAVEQVRDLAALARQEGLRRLVLLSGRGEDEALLAEEAAREAGPALTVVRASWFVQNMTEGEFAPMVAAGEVALPVGAVPEPFIDADDVADVAVAALLDARHEGETYVVTGPRSLTFADLTAETARARERAVRYVELDLDEAEQGWRREGLPPELVLVLRTLFGTVFDGRNVTPTDDVRRALGRPARDPREHLAAAGVPA